MEEPNGPSLAAVVATHGPLPARSVLILAAGLAEALSVTHAADAVYPDLTPASVLLTADGPRLTGFAISRAAERWQAAGSGALPVTPGFTSPERAEGHDAGPASDIYSLGAVLLYAATGAGMSRFAGHPDQLPGELRPVIQRCMAPDPARRPTAAELLTELTAAHPDAVSHVDWLPAGALAAGTQAPALPFPAQTVGPQQKVSRRTALIRRYAWLTATAVLVFVVAAWTVYVIHPWPYPVQRPTGLTAEQQGTNSISIGWSNPGSGPLPDKYVILRNGAVAATVPGNVNHFWEGGLAPATTYDFRVIAYRGRLSPQSSLDLRAATLTPPPSEAAFNSSFNVTETLKSGGESVTGDADGDVWHDTWTFFANCSLGPCVTQLSGTIDGESGDFTAVLKPAGRGSYTGTAAINDYYTCSSNQTDYEDSTLKITVTPSAGQAQGMQWQATKFSGDATWDIVANPDGSCGGGTLVISISG